MSILNRIRRALAKPAPAPEPQQPTAWQAFSFKNRGTHPIHYKYVWMRSNAIKELTIAYFDGEHFTEYGSDYTLSWRTLEGLEWQYVELPRP